MKFFTLIILMLISSLIYAQNSTITYQGYLKANDAPVNETVDFVVNYQPDGNQAGSYIQSETFNSILVIDGLFTLPLGSTSLTIPLEEMFSIYPNVWIELLVNGVVQFPWQKIRLAPYAIDSLTLDGRASDEYALTTETTYLQSQIDNLNITPTPWVDGFGGTQYIGDVIIGDLAASAGDTLQVLSEVDESPLRLLVGGVGTRFRVSKNGGTGIGANYSDGQIPDNGLRVKGDVVLEGGGGSASGISLNISSPTGTQPFSANVNGNTALQVASNSGIAVGSGQVSAFPPPANGLRVSGKSTLSDETTINDDLIVKRDAKHTHTNSYGFVKAGIEFSCGNIGTTRLSYFNNINTDEITVQNGGAFGLCTVALPFSFADLYFQTQIESTLGASGAVIAGSCRKTFSGPGGSELVACDLYDVENNTNIVTANRVTLLMF